MLAKSLIIFRLEIFNYKGKYRAFLKIKKNFLTWMLRYMYSSYISHLT